MSAKVKNCLNFVFLILLVFITLKAVFEGEDLKLTLAQLAQIEPFFVVLGIGCVILFICGESVVIWYLLRVLKVRVPFLNCCIYSFIGFFYSSITPSASGGQPMQILAMRKNRIPVGVSTIVLAVVTITYKLVLVAIGLFVLIFKPAGIMLYLDSVMPYMYLGIVLNVLCVAGLLMLVFEPGAVRAIVSKCLNLWNKIRPASNSEKLTSRFNRLIEQYEGSAEVFRSHPHVIVHVFAITLIQRCTLFFIAWITYCAFGCSSHSPFVIVGLYAMISVAADMLPLPGGVGISETLYLVIFEPVFTEVLVLPAMIVTRGISYYSQLLISAAVTLASPLILDERKKGV